jgi:hypothetical protein
VLDRLYESAEPSLVKPVYYDRRETFAWDADWRLAEASQRCTPSTDTREGDSSAAVWLSPNPLFYSRFG